MADKLTFDQANAVNSDSGAILVAAAAGSGKTSVLTQRIIRKLTGEKAVAPDSLLVVTFTKAAAAEMKRRITEGITAMMDAEPERYAELARIRAGLAGMNVSTMDSFCMTLVKANCHALGIDADVNVMDSGEAKALKKKVVEGILDDMLTSDREGFETLARVFSKTGNDSGIADAIFRISDFSMSEPAPERWLAELPLSYTDASTDCEWTDVIRRRAALLADYAGRLLDDCASLVGDVDGEQNREKLAEFIDSHVAAHRAFTAALAGCDWDALAAAAKTAAAEFGSRFPSCQKAGTAKDSIKSKHDVIKDLMADKIPGMFCATSREHAEDLAALLPSVKKLSDTAIAYGRALLEAKKAKRAYEFGDVMHFALDILYDADAEDKKTPLARELAEGFDEILIDEYQDTNAAQDALFRCLSKGDGENMFMVGDVKQSIYRFRLADPAVFMEKCDSFPEWDGSAPKSKILLRENFRCRRGVVDGVNFIFDALMSREAGDVDYDEDSRLRYGAKYYDEAGDRAEPEFSVRVLACEKGKTTEQEARWIANDIKRRLAFEKVLTRDGLRDAVPGDFAVIIRAPGPLSATYKEVFERCGLGIVAGKNGNLYEFAEIRLLIDLLKLIDDPCDDVAAAGVMLSGLFGFTPDDLATLKLSAPAEEKRRPPLAALAAASGDSKCAAFTAKLNYLRMLSETEGPAELLRDIDDEFSYSDTLRAMEEGETRYNNVKLFTDVAAAAESRGMNTAGRFVKYVDEIRESGAEMKSAVSGGESCVRLMSVHQSKGLEFPFVYVASLNRQFNQKYASFSPICSHDGVGLKRRETEELRFYKTIPFVARSVSAVTCDLSEEIRLYYVAMTRAKESLTVVCPVGSDNGTEGAKEKLRSIADLIPSGGGIHPGFILTQSKPLGWFIAAMLSHEDAGELRSSLFPVRRGCGRADVAIEFAGGEDEAEATETEEENVPVSAELLGRITERASYVYPYAPVASALSKYTASSHDDRVFSRQKFTRSKPQFLNPDGMLTGAERGTATHVFMEYCGFDACENDVEAEIERVAALGKLSPAQAASLDREAIRAFISSPVMGRIRAADEVWREKRFSVVMPLTELEKGVPERFSDECAVLIGQIDLLFVSGDDAVIVDYKTDRVGDMTELARRYSDQMRLYVRAAAMSLELNVKECVIYSLTLRDFITLDADGKIIGG